MRTTRMLGVTAVMLCGSLLLGSPLAFACGPSVPPSGGDSSSSSSPGGDDADPPEMGTVDPPEVDSVDPPEVDDPEPADPPVRVGPTPPAPVRQPADPGGDFVPASAPGADGMMNPWWIITDFRGRCALAHQPTFELGNLFKGPFTTFGAGAVEMGALGAPGGWPAPATPPAPGSPCTGSPGGAAVPAAPPGGVGAPASSAGFCDSMNPCWIITDFQGRCALARVPTFELGHILSGPFDTFAAGAAAMGEQGAPGGWPAPATPPAPGAPPGLCTVG